MAVQRIDDFLAGVPPEAPEKPYSHKRGKITPSAKPAWGTKDAMGRERDLGQEAQDVLDETLRN
jgi:hypothetical protein